MIGDSTMSIKPQKAIPENGWGMALEHYYARNGRSSKSFIKEGLWDSAWHHLSSGDLVLSHPAKIA